MSEDEGVRKLVEMPEQTYEIGIVGLGRMGGGLALQALEKGVRVVGFSRGRANAELLRAGLFEAASLVELPRMLKPPRAVFLYIPAGPAVDEVLDELTGVLHPEDVVVDGGNSYWGDSIRRAKRLGQRGMYLVDLGTSGGISGARHGACFMAGGDEKAIARIEPLLKALSVPGGYVRAGPSGAGHFTKLVHNGIEFGMLQAIGEGVALLEGYRERLPVAEILRCWRFGSVIRSWLIDLMDAEYRSHSGLQDVPSYVDDTGEVSWLVSDALRMEIPVPVISQSVMQLLHSRDASSHWSRAIALMRYGFGGHPPGPVAEVEHERRVGRVGDYFREEDEANDGSGRSEGAPSVPGGNP